MESTRVGSRLTKNKATLIGVSAILLWSAVVGLIRGVSENLGATGGAAAIYSVASVFLLLSVGLKRLASFPRRYLVWGSILFVAYELCFSLSIGYANNSRQAIEASMVNYLWPSLTMLAAIVVNKHRASWLIMPGLALAILGICRVLGGDEGLNLESMLFNVQDNPLSYGLAFAGALIWAAYCTITARIAQGANGITLFFILTALVLWIKYLIGGGGQMDPDTHALLYLVLAGAAMGFGYAAWNIGILHGHVTILAGASYFVPVLSAVLSALILSTTLPLSFWQGAAMVCAGSILCWISTRRKKVTH
ncbi:aromatic amino acid DMT transporter YddG [Bordetella genomosp. 4]|uniref:aromatic amino acid DMT transporter YddG n=1 Tax=Bordetella genomosp. 4 TaxID=463044 RepID=UPI000B9ECB7D|nr:aromatic amino acid DMT transporter YddG [Bordetella genomosp. 4]OZI47152.1 EamA family transporter [Bordetella genomosp. 4]